MLAKFRQFWQPPHFPSDEEKTQKAHWLNIVLFANLCLVLLALIIALILPGTPLAIFIVALVTLGFIPILRHQLNLGRVTEVGYGVIFIFSGMITAALYLIGTLNTPVVAAYVLVVVTCGLVEGRRLAFRTVVLEVVLVSALALGEKNNLLFHPRWSSPLFDWSILVGLLVYAGMYAYWIQKSIAEMLTRARKDVAYRTAELRAANTSLLSENAERKRAEERLRYAALHDGLTGLPNRILLTERLEQAVKFQKRCYWGRFAVLFMDLDEFKDINDSLGHSIGDRLLVAAAQRMQSCLRSTDTLARLGGDEFVILLEHVEDINDATQIAERIQTELRQPFDLDGVQVITSASIGIVLCDNERLKSDEILRDADIAMYRAKSDGRARHQVFDVTWREAVVTRMRLESDLRRALQLSEMEVFYQPILALKNGSLCGFEALARWRHPRLGLLLPVEFIPLAEERNLIVPLDCYIMKSACQQINEWQQSFHKPLCISVNVSSRQFAQPDLMDQVQSALTASGLPAHLLRLEITESTIIENLDQATHAMNQLQARGIQVGIDDFGTGFSSLTYLYQLPAAILKIDRTFIRDMTADERRPEVVRTIIHLAHTLGMSVVAEGIDTPGQLRLLRQMGCDFAQGFLFSAPLDRANAEAYIRRWLKAAPDTHMFEKVEAMEDFIYNE